MELLGKRQHFVEASNQPCQDRPRLGSVAMHACGRTQLPSKLEEDNKFCSAVFRINARRFVTVSSPDATLCPLAEGEVVQPRVEPIYLPLFTFLPQPWEWQKVVSWLLAEWELTLYPETHLRLGRELASFVPAIATEAHQKGFNRLEFTVNIEEFTTVVQDQE